MPFALEAGVRLVEAEIDEEAFFDGLLVVVEEGRRLVVAPEDAEGVAVDEVGGRGGQTDHPRVEVLDDFGEALEDRAMGFVEDDEVEEAGLNFVAERPSSARWRRRGAWSCRCCPCGCGRAARAADGP